MLSVESFIPLRKAAVISGLALLLSGCLKQEKIEEPVAVVDDTPTQNRAPDIQGTSATSVQAGSMYRFVPTVSDADGDALTFDIANRPSWASFDAMNGELAGIPAETDAGTTYADIVISVSDDTDTASLSPFSISVVDAGTAGPPPSGQYVGYGAVTQGANSCPGVMTTYRVTSLSAGTGPGTLRDAISDDCRHIVFDVAGNIDLAGTTLDITKSYLTIDGASAPAPGITIINAEKIVLEARTGPGGTRPYVAVHDVIVNNIRAIGDQPRGQFDAAGDLWELDGSSGFPDGKIYNVILDHLTNDAAGNGNVDIYGIVHDVTVSNSFFHDSLQGQHVSMSGGLRERITFYGNVYAHINERQPRWRYSNREMEFIGNVIYGWGYYECGAAGLNINTGTGADASGNIEWNIYHFVQADPNVYPEFCGRPNDAIRIESVVDSAFYLASNRWPAGEDDVMLASTSPVRINTVRPDGIDYAAPRMTTDIVSAGTFHKTAEEIALLQEIAQAVSE